MSKTIDRVKEIFDLAVESGPELGCELEDIDHCNLMFKGGMQNSLYQIMGCNLSVFSLDYESVEAILMSFAIPIKEKGSKHIVERIMDIVRVLEGCFTTLDYCKSHEVREDKYAYLTAIKKIQK